MYFLHTNCNVCPTAFMKNDTLPATGKECENEGREAWCEPIDGEESGENSRHGFVVERVDGDDVEMAQETWRDVVPPRCHRRHKLNVLSMARQRK